MAIMSTDNTKVEWFGSNSKVSDVNIRHFPLVFQWYRFEDLAIARIKDQHC